MAGAAPHPPARGESEAPTSRDHEVAAPCAFVIFGVTGDLSSRKLLPALYALHRDGLLHQDSTVIGFGRSDWDDEALRSHARASVEEHGQGLTPSLWSELAPRLRFVRGSYGDGDGMLRLKELLEELGHQNAVYYTATPPQAYGQLVEALGSCGLNATGGGWSRLVIEKPYGHDLASARDLNRTVTTYFDEQQIYRIDHYLAKETAQNLAVLRFANTLFEPVWSNRYIDHVQLTMAESVGVEGRGGFYEQAGVIRDVFQNHLLQLIALVAMEPPARYDATSVRNEKVKVLEAISCVDPANAVLGQYGAANGIPGYREEEGVSSDSRQATFAAARFEISNWRWSGVPFYVRSGKRLEQKATEAVLHFRTPPHIPFALPSAPPPDRLVLRVAPDEGIVLRFNAKVPGQGIGLQRASMEFTYAESFAAAVPDAYETLLLDTMTGDATLFMRWDEVEAQWQVVTPLLEFQEEGRLPTCGYPAGSMGPLQANELLERQGRSWHRPVD